MELNQMLTWMLSEATPSGSSNMDMIMKKVLRYRAIEEGGKTVSDVLGIGGDKMQDLEEMNMRLDILRKKKALGMDYDDSLEFQDAINDSGKDRAVKGIFAKRAADIAEKHPLAAKNSQTLDAILKDAFAMEGSPSAGALDRRKAVFKTAYNAVSSGKTHSGTGLLSKILGGLPHGSSTNLLKYIR